MRKLWAAGVLLFALVAAGIPAHAAIQGDYLEVRSADVFTGPCFANSEVGLVGNEAILAWKVRKGSWNGVDLSGLGVVAVVKASATLGDTFHNPFPAKAVLILDEQATGKQRQALAGFAKAMAGKLLDNVVNVQTSAIDMTAGEGTEHGRARLVAGTLARIETRSLCAGDHLCGNEVVWYPPLAEVSHAMPAFTLAESFTGQGLGMVWKRADKRSAFVGTFNL